MAHRLIQPFTRRGFFAVFIVSVVLFSGLTPYSSQELGASANAYAGAPTSFTATPSNGQVDLSWGIPQFGAAAEPCDGFQYEVQKSTDGVNWVDAISAPIQVPECVPVLRDTFTTSFSFPDDVNQEFNPGADDHALRILAWLNPDASAGPRREVFVASPDVKVESFYSVGRANKVSLTWEPEEAPPQLIGPFTTATEVCSGGSYVIQVTRNFINTPPAQWTDVHTVNDPPCVTPPPPSESSATISSLENGKEYSFRVLVRSTSSPTDFGDPAEVGPVVPSTIPGAPGGVTASAGNAQVTLSWTAPASGGSAVTAYEYEISRDGGAFGSPVAVGGSVTSVTVTGLDNGTPYVFRVTARNANGLGPQSLSSSVTPEVPAPPSGGGQTSPGSGGQSSATSSPSSARPTAPPAVSSSVVVPPRVTTPSPQTSGQTPSASGLSAAQSGPLATVGGQVVTVESTATSSTQLALQVGKVSLGVSVGNGLGTVGSNGSGANGSDALGIQLANGAATTFEGGGLTPGSAVSVVLPLGGDDSAVLAVLEVAEDGTFSGEAAFGTTPDGDPLPIGVRVVQLFAVDEDGNDVVIEVAVTIGQPDPAPAINRADGSVPALTPGEALGTSAGLPQVIEVLAIEEQKRAVVDGGDWSMAVDVASSTGGVQSVDAGAQLTLVRDESAMVSGSGFMAGTRADVWLFSEPTLLGTVTVDDNGEFVGEVTIDGIVIPPGDHTLQLQGVGQDGYVKATSLGVAVDDATAPLPISADTTSSSVWMLFLAIGGLTILLIAVFIVAVRRKLQKQ